MKKEKEYTLVVMAFDGDYKRDFTGESVEDCWDVCADLGSKWFFYPCCFVVDEDDVVVEAGGSLHGADEHGDMVPILDPLIRGMGIDDVASIFESVASLPETENAGIEDFEIAVCDYIESGGAK